MSLASLRILRLLDRSKLPELEREQVNPWFEAWYNADGPEQPTYVPYHFLFGPRTYEFPPHPRRRESRDLEQDQAGDANAVADTSSPTSCSGR